MRNAYFFEKFRVASPQLDREMAIHQGAARELQIQAEKVTKRTRGKNGTQQTTSEAAHRVTLGGSVMGAPTTARGSRGGGGAGGGMLRTLLNAQTQSQSVALGAVGGTHILQESHVVPSHQLHNQRLSPAYNNADNQNLSLYSRANSRSRDSLGQLVTFP